MAISGISSIPTYMTFRSVNETSARQGQQATGAAMREARQPMTVSNFGTQTKLGSSLFQQNNERVDNQGQQATGAAMREARQPMTVSNFGSETKLGSSSFQQNNQRIDSQGQQATHARMEEVAALYRKTASYGNPVLGGNMNISA